MFARRRPESHQGRGEAGIGLVADQRREVGTEERADLSGYGAKQLARRDVLRHQRRDPPECRLLARELFQVRTRFAFSNRGADQLGEFRDALLGVGRKRLALIGNRHDAPQAALDRDRSGNGGDVVHLPEAVGDLPRHILMTGVVAARGPAGAVRRGRGQEVLKRPARSDRDDRDALG